VAGPGGLFGGTMEDGVFERLGGVPAAGAGGGEVAVPGRVGAEVALPGSHLVKVAGGEFVEPHKRVGLD